MADFLLYFIRSWPFLGFLAVFFADWGAGSMVARRQGTWSPRLTGKGFPRFVRGMFWLLFGGLIAKYSGSDAMSFLLELFQQNGLALGAAAAQARGIAPTWASMTDNFRALGWIRPDSKVTRTLAPKVGKPVIGKPGQVEAPPVGETLPPGPVEPELPA